MGDYVKKQNGYRQKTNLFRLTWSEQTVLEKIHSLDDAERKSRCISAYEFLMSHEESAYAKFVNLRETSFEQSKRFNTYDFTQNEANSDRTAQSEDEKYAKFLDHIRL